MHVDPYRPRPLVASPAWRDRRVAAPIEPDVRAAQQLRDELAAMADRAGCEILGKDERQAATGTAWPSHR